MKKFIAILLVPLLLGATDQQPEKGSVSVVPAVSPSHAFPVGQAVNGNVSPLRVDDAGAVVMSNPGGGGGGGTSANVQDAGVAFNNVGNTVLGKGVNGIAYPLALDDAGAVILSNPGGGGGSVTISGQPIQVYFDGGTVTCIPSGTTATTLSGIPQVYFDGGAVNATIVGIPQVYFDGGVVTANLGGSVAPGSGNRVGTSTTSGSWDAGANQWVRITCDADSWYLVGAGAVLANFDGGSNFISAKAVETFQLTGSNTNVSFVVGSGTGNCYGATRP